MICKHSLKWTSSEASLHIRSTVRCTELWLHRSRQRRSWHLCPQAECAAWWRGKARASKGLQGWLSFLLAVGHNWDPLNWMVNTKEWPNRSVFARAQIVTLIPPWQNVPKGLKKWDCSDEKLPSCGWNQSLTTELSITISRQIAQIGRSSELVNLDMDGYGSLGFIGWLDMSTHVKDICMSRYTHIHIHK